MSAVLIIDDDAAVRRFLRAALVRAGHTVAEAANGAAGLRLYREAQADLVITDVYMPELDGIETIQQLREEFPESRIVAISGGGGPGVGDPLTDARLLGADATLSKPFSPEDLLRTVNELLAS